MVKLYEKVSTMCILDNGSICCFVEICKTGNGEYVVLGTELSTGNKHILCRDRKLKVCRQAIKSYYIA